MRETLASYYVNIIYGFLIKRFEVKYGSHVTQTEMIVKMLKEVGYKRDLLKFNSCVEILCCNLRMVPYSNILRAVSSLF